MGLTETASTFFLLEKNADSGPILSQIEILIEDDDTATSLYKKLLKLIPTQIDDIISEYLGGTMQPVVQDTSQVNYFRRRSRKDGLIDWRMTTNSICNLVRALAKPYPGAEIKKNGEYFKVWDVLPYSEQVAVNIEPGKVIYQSTLGPVVKTGDGAICLIITEPKLKITIGDYL